MADERLMFPAPYERRCVCGWLHRALRAAGLKDRHEHRCEVAHGLGFNAYVREQRALLQQQHGGSPRSAAAVAWRLTARPPGGGPPRYLPVSVDERDGHARRN